MVQVPKVMLRKRIAQPDTALRRGIRATYGKTSENFVADARPVGGSLFHIHRDTRLTKNQTPYKTHTGAYFGQVRALYVQVPEF